MVEYKNISKDELQTIVKKSRIAFHDWKKNIKKRADYLHIFAQELRKEKAKLARVATNEMGKPIKESISEVEKCAWAMEFYGDNGEIFLNPEVVNTDARKSYISFEPLGDRKSTRLNSSHSQISYA